MHPNFKVYYVIFDVKVTICSSVWETRYEKQNFVATNVFVWISTSSLFSCIFFVEEKSRSSHLKV